MRLTFNTAGDCRPREHYMIPPERRLGQVMSLISERKYFVFYAGHQTGKTTCVKWLTAHYNAGAERCAVWVDLQTAREEPDLPKAMRTVTEKLDHAVSRDLPQVPRQGLAGDGNPATALVHAVRALCAAAPRPVVVFFDEADGLVGPAMVSFLTQLRDGYLDRDKIPFPHSVVLIGRRVVRDYVVSTQDRKAIGWLGTSSPFNITAEATQLGPFTQDEVLELLGQHTAETGQVFLAPAGARVWELSQGHPWLVNALADQIVRRDVPDRAVAITAAHVDAARDTLILERRSHIDALIARLHEPRVQRILEPMLTGGRIPGAETLDDDLSYVAGLGILTLRNGEYQIANPIYREVIPRVLSYVQQVQIHLPPRAFLLPDGGLDMSRLMREWQTFWRKDGHLAAAGFAFAYKEAGPHLMLMAYLQRVINGGGRIEREYGLGRGALDLVVWYGGEAHAIEVKLRRDTETKAEALDQLAAYLDQAGLETGWLVLFDLRKRRAWSQKLTLAQRKRGGKRIHVVGC